MKKNSIAILCSILLAISAIISLRTNEIAFDSHAQNALTERSASFQNNLE
jgi:hypothetical protein